MTLFEEAKRFFEKAIVDDESAGQQANLHAALMLAFCSLEAHTNAIAADFAAVDTSLSVHEKAFLLEKDVRMVKGRFEMTSTLKAMRLEDRIQFLHRRYSCHPIDTTEVWWS